MSEKCAICTDTFNSSSRSRVACIQCKKDACRACYTRYFLSRLQEPCCMYCNVALQYENIYSAFPKSFWNKDYKRHRETILYDLERAQCAASLPYVQISVEQDVVRKELHLIQAEIKRQQTLTYQLKRQEDKLQRRIATLGQVNNETGSPLKKRATGEYFTPCNTTNCRGFVTKENPICACCGFNTCHSCHQTIQVDIENDWDFHVCLADDVATVQELRRNTKQCPECKISISKVDGCDQMFCVACHTAFSWNTGERVTGPIHNPHYFEVRAQLGENIANRNVNGGGCNDAIPDIRACRIAINGNNTHLPEGPETTLRYATHISNVVLRELRHYTNGGRAYSFETNLRQRVSWMRQQQTDGEFRLWLQRSDKKSRYHTELLSLFQMYVNVVGELFQNLMVQKSLASYQDIVMLKKYTLEHLVAIKGRYGSQCVKYDRYISDLGALEKIPQEILSRTVT